MAAKYEKELEARQKAKAEMESIRATAEKEAEAVARYIQNLDIKLRKTQLIVQHPKTMKQQAVNSQYITGKSQRDLIIDRERAKVTFTIVIRQGFAL